MPTDGDLIKITKPTLLLVLTKEKDLKKSMFLKENEYIMFIGTSPWDHLTEFRYYPILYKTKIYFLMIVVD